MVGAGALRQCMVEGLTQRGELDERWRAALTEVPRYEFIPELIWRYDRDAASHGDMVPLRHCDDPQGWLERAYANAPVATRVARGVRVRGHLLGVDAGRGGADACRAGG